MPKLKAGTIIPTPEEDAIIQKGIDADPDTWFLTDEEWEKCKRLGGAAWVRAKIKAARET